MKRKEIGLYRTQNEKKYNEIKNKHFQLYGKLDDEKRNDFFQMWVDMLEKIWHNIGTRTTKVVH